MPIRTHEIRVCNSCGLRYPFVEGHPFGTRCPACTGDTRVAVRRESSSERRDTGTPKNERGKNLAVLLDNIRSAWNVGSILRSADGFGLSHAYLCGITPTGDNEAVTKTSLGAEDSVPWSHHKDAVKLAKGLKTEGWRIYVLEEDVRGVEIGLAGTAASGPRPEVLVIGNEVTGVDPELLELCDQVFYIPMRGEKRSFNVAIAFGIAAFALTTQEMPR